MRFGRTLRTRLALPAPEGGGASSVRSTPVSSSRLNFRTLHTAPCTQPRRPGRGACRVGPVCNRRHVTTAYYAGLGHESLVSVRLWTRAKPIHVQCTKPIHVHAGSHSHVYMTSLGAWGAADVRGSEASAHLPECWNAQGQLRVLWECVANVGRQVLSPKASCDLESVMRMWRRVLSNLIPRASCC